MTSGWLGGCSGIHEVQFELELRRFRAESCVHSSVPVDTAAGLPLDLDRGEEYRAQGPAYPRSPDVYGCG